MGNMKTFFGCNKTIYKVLRTIAEGVVSVVIVNLDMLVSMSAWIPAEVKPFAVAVIVAILTPIAAALGDGGDVPVEVVQYDDEGYADDVKEITEEEGERMEKAEGIKV